jgi:hypothetical protein
MATLHRSKKTETFLTRWTRAQIKTIKREAYKRGISANEYIERRVFNLPLEIHPHEIKNGRGPV